MERVKKILKEYNIADADLKISKMTEYMEGTLEWNNKVNITAITNKEEFVEKHYVDSLSGMICPEFADAKNIMDVGSGGGFPAVPLAITFPEKQFTLLDSSAKRMNIVRGLTEELEIENVITVHGRAEDYGREAEFREIFDLCISRAVANMSTLSEYCLPFVKVDGSFIAYKGEGAETELESAKNALEILGGTVSAIYCMEETPFYSEGCKDHRLLVISKISPTPDKYPRLGAKPVKRPL